MDSRRELQNENQNIQRDYTRFLRENRQNRDLSTRAQETTNDENRQLVHQIDRHQVNVAQLFNSYEQAQADGYVIARQSWPRTEISQLAAQMDVEITKAIEGATIVQERMQNNFADDDNMKVHFAFLRGIYESLDDLRTGFYFPERRDENIQAAGALGFLRKLKQDRAEQDDNNPNDNNPTFQLLLRNDLFRDTIDKVIKKLDDALGNNF